MKHLLSSIYQKDLTFLSKNLSIDVAGIRNELQISPYNWERFSTSPNGATNYRAILDPSRCKGIFTVSPEDTDSLISFVNPQTNIPTDVYTASPSGIELFVGDFFFFVRKKQTMYWNGHLPFSTEELENERWHYLRAGSSAPHTMPQRLQHWSSNQLTINDSCFRTKPQDE